MKTCILLLIAASMLVLARAEDAANFPDHYKELGLERNCTSADIRRASRLLLARNHPDKGGVKERFMAINEANRVLSDGLLRNKYDEELEYYELYGYTALRYKRYAPPNNVLLVIVVSVLGSALLQFLYMKSRRRQVFEQVMALPKNKRKVDDPEFIREIREELGLHSNMAIFKETFLVTMWKTIPALVVSWWTAEKPQQKGNLRSSKSKSLSPDGASRATYLRFALGFLAFCVVYFAVTSWVVWRTGLDNPFFEMERTGMRPLYEKGDMLVIEWGKSVRADLKVGDVVGFQLWEGEAPTVHRIIEASKDSTIVGDNWHMITKGDALDKNDQERNIYPTDSPFLTDSMCFGRVIYKLPAYQAAFIKLFFQGQLGPWLILFVAYCFLASHMADKARKRTAAARRKASLKSK